MIDHKWIKELAKIRVKQKVDNDEDLEVFLGIWWSRKYSLPSNHALFLDRTLEEHLLDYYTNDMLDNPSKEETTIAELDEDEEWYKKEMGEDYHEEYDFLIPVGSKETVNGVMEKEKMSLNNEEQPVMEDIEEDFEEYGKD